MNLSQILLQTQYSSVDPPTKSEKVKQLISPATIFDFTFVKAQVFNLGTFLMMKLKASCWILVKAFVSPCVKPPTTVLALFVFAALNHRYLAEGWEQEAEVEEMLSSRSLVIFLQPVQ